MQAAKYLSPIGEIRMLASDKGLAAIYFPPQAQALESRLAPSGLRRGHGNKFLLQAEAYLACYFDGDLDYAPEIALDLRGTPFQIEAWNALTEILPGERSTYLALASRLGRPTATRAIGAAVGRNLISVLLPCHRVIGSDGSLTGYAGGLQAKRFLLDHEQRHASLANAIAA